MDNIIAKAQVSTRGQIAIPKTIKDKMKIQEGDYIVFIQDDDKIVIKTARLILQ